MGQFQPPTYLTIGDETLRLFEWSRRTGNSVPLIVGRVKAGWTIERAVLTPARKYRDNQESNGNTHN